MGAWGYGAFNSDAALDWLGPISKDVCGRIGKTLRTFRRGSEHEMIAAADLLLKLSSRKSPLCISYDAMHWDGRRRTRSGKQSTLFGRAIATLLVIDDTGWPDEWREPAKMRATLKRLVSQLKRRESAERKSHESMLKRVIVRKSGKRKPKKVAA